MATVTGTGPNSPCDSLVVESAPRDDGSRIQGGLGIRIIRIGGRFGSGFGSGCGSGCDSGDGHLETGMGRLKTTSRPLIARRILYTYVRPSKQCHLGEPRRKLKSGRAAQKLRTIRCAELFGAVIGKDVSPMIT